MLNENVKNRILLMLFFLALYSSFSLCHAEQLKDKYQEEKQENRLYCVPLVEYRNQNEKGRSQWCVIYSTYMLLTRYGIHEKPEDIAKEMDMEERGEAYFSWKSFLSEDGSVERYLQDKHNLKTRKKIFVTLRKPYERWIKQNIKEGNPVLLLYGRMNGHAILLVGYDEKNLYINDPSGAFFSDSTKVLGKPTYPSVWCSEKRSSRFEGAGVKWSDFRKFLKKHNYWGYMLAVTGRREKQKKEEQKLDGKGGSEKISGVGDRKSVLSDPEKRKILF